MSSVAPEIFCPHCGTRSPCDSLFCFKCGGHLVKPEVAVKDDAAFEATAIPSQAATPQADSCDPQKHHTDAQTLSANEVALSQAFRWWPRTIIASLAQAVYLGLLLWFGDDDVCPELPTLYVAAIFFFVFSGIRYGWYRFQRMGQPLQRVPVWQNPGYIALAVLLINFAVVMPLIRNHRNHEPSLFR